MKIYRIAEKKIITEANLKKWIYDLVVNEYGGVKGSTEGWCGEVAGDIYKYLKSFGERPEMWGYVDWNSDNDSYKPAIIENPTMEEVENIRNEITGAFTHSFIKWNNKFWDGKGERTIEEISSEHGFGQKALGNGQSIMKEF